MMDTRHLLAPPKHHELFLHKQRAYVTMGGIIAVFFLTLSVSLALSRTSLTGRAAGPGVSGVFSPENSYIFASPITAKAKSGASIRVTVILLTTEGLGVRGQEVSIASGLPLTVTPVNAISDDFGRAIFDVNASNPGDYTITAATQGVSLLQKVSISFQ